MDDNPEIRDRLNVNKSTYHNKRPRERFICFIRGAKWMKINQLNGPSPIHDTSTWLSQSIQSITHVCYWLGMQKNLPWKCFRTPFGHYDFRSTSASQQDWRMRKRYHLLLWGLKLLFKKQKLKSKLSPINGIIREEKIFRALYICKESAGWNVLKMWRMYESYRNKLSIEYKALMMDTGWKKVFPFPFL